MHNLVAILSLSTFFSTLIGGLFALRYRNRLPLILGFTAGVLLGVVAFDILPEVFRLVQANHFDPTRPMLALVIGFLAFHVAEKLTLVHHSHETEYGAHHHPHVGLISALALSGHSFLDGVGIGLAFQVNTQVGLLVAVAVIAHDFSDGLNTVTLMLNHKNTDRRSIQLLLLDAAAPVLGAASTLFFSLSAGVLVLYLGFFAGFLLYIGSSDILPEAHRDRASRAAIAATILGTAAIFLVTRISF